MATIEVEQLGGVVPSSADKPSYETWDSSAPAELLEAYQRRDSENAWRLWQRHLSTRKSPVALTKLVRCKGSPLAWCLPDQIHVGELLALNSRLRRSRQQNQAGSAFGRHIEQWLQEGQANEVNLQRAAECLTWCHALPTLASHVQAQSWWDLVEFLIQTAKDAAAISPESAPLVHQWLAAEMPLTLAYLLPELTPCRLMAEPARVSFSQGLVDLLDGEGLIQARHWNSYRPLLACWTRARALGEQLGGAWNSEAEDQYQWAVRQNLRLMRRDRSQDLTEGRGGSYNEALFQAATNFLVDKQHKNLATALLIDKRAQKTKLPNWASIEPSMHSEWAEAAVLRSTWSDKSPRLTVTYHGAPVNMELSVGRDVLWRGPWHFEIQVNGTNVSVDSPWEEVCWVADSDVIYVELEAGLTGSMRIQRQILLAREDNFVFLADAVLGQEPAEINYRATLPLSDRITFAPAQESREGFLEGRKYRGLAIPLALPEWRSDRRVGELRATDEGIELTQHTTGKSMFAPLWIDLDRKRMLKPCTWRSLTVAQTREIQPRDTAVGYRVQLGKKHWLVYRSLTKPANRTVLGQNLASEFLVGRFDNEGTTDSLIEIE